METESKTNLQHSSESQVSTKEKAAHIDEESWTIKFC